MEACSATYLEIYSSRFIADSIGADYKSGKPSRQNETKFPIVKEENSVIQKILTLILPALWR